MKKPIKTSSKQYFTLIFKSYFLYLLNANHFIGVKFLALPMNFGKYITVHIIDLPIK